MHGFGEAEFEPDLLNITWRSSLRKTSDLSKRSAGMRTAVAVKQLSAFCLSMNPIRTSRLLTAHLAQAEHTRMARRLLWTHGNGTQALLRSPFDLRNETGTGREGLALTSWTSLCLTQATVMVQCREEVVNYTVYLGVFPFQNTTVSISESKP